MINVTKICSLHKNTHMYASAQAHRSTQRIQRSIKFTAIRYLLLAIWKCTVSQQLHFKSFLCELLYSLCIAVYFRRTCARVHVSAGGGAGAGQELMFGVLNTLSLTLWQYLADLELMDLARMDGQQTPRIHLFVPSQHWDLQTFLWALETWTLVLMHFTEWASSPVLSLHILQDSLSMY